MKSAVSAQRNIVLFELNEVPFRVLDWYAARHPESPLARVLEEGRTYETFSEDSGRLSPWRTWPSLHRGVNDQQHFIHDFGQDLSEVDREFPPIWRLLAENGISTGLCGSLHSYPLPESLQNIEFYLPDTFAAGSECFPSSIQPFQEFNLQMARESARNVRSGIPWASAARFLGSLPSLGIKFSSAADVVRQLVDERKDKWKTVRRRTYQSVLAFDIFMRQLNRTRPAFSTFFTNHVASAQHRYWAALFPGDYDDLQLSDDWLTTYDSEIEFAMQKADVFIRRLTAFADRNPDYEIWITTSMGQEATRAEEIETQLYLTEPKKFMAFCNVAEHSWSIQPAMLPQFNVSIDPDKAESFNETLEHATIANEHISFRRNGASFFSIDFGQVNLDPCQKARIGSRELDLGAAGLKNVEIQDRSGTTAYHVPEGSLIIYDPRNRAERVETRSQISTLDLTPCLLSNFDVAAPGYMNKVPRSAI